MRRSARSLAWLIVAIFGVGFPALALAGSAGSTRDLVLDFTRSGAMKDLLAKTLSVAKGFLFLSAFLGYGIEAFGRSPAAERDYAAVTWRLVIVLFLLWNYQAVFGGVIALIDRVAAEVAPPSTWQALVKHVGEMRKALDDLAAHGQEVAGDPASVGAGGLIGAAGAPKGLTAWAYEALIACVQLLAEGLVFLVNWLSRILTATLFILGPLALVAGIPRVSSTGTRWFHRFVTIASWPVFSGVLLSVLVTLGAQGVLRRSYIECLVAALVMLVTALATPALASHVIGGALENLHGAGFRHAKNTHRDLVMPIARTVSAAVGGVAGRAGAAMSATAGRASGGGARGGQGGGDSGGGGGGGGSAGGSGGAIANPPGQGDGGRRARGGGAASGAEGRRGRGAGAGEAAREAGATGQGSVIANPPVPPSPPARAGPSAPLPKVPSGENHPPKR